MVENTLDTAAVLQQATAVLTAVPLAAEPIEANAEVATTPIPVEDRAASSYGETAHPLPRLLTTGVRGRRPAIAWLIGVPLAIVVVAGAAVGSVYARQLIEVRDAAITAQHEQIVTLTGANLSLQDQLKASQDQFTSAQGQITSLSGDNQQLTSDLAARSAERDSLASQRDQLQAQFNDLQAHATQTDQALADINRQLADARAAGAAQQDRADSAEARTRAIAAVVTLDNQINSEYTTFLQAFDATWRAYNSGNYIAAATDYAQAQASANRLDDLFRRRNVALSQL